MSQKTDAELLVQAGVIKNETEDGANTAARIGAMYDNIIDSKLNNEGVGTLIAAATSKTTPVDGDSTIISDSEASGAQKKLTWANLKATLKTYFDSLYQAALGYTAENTSNKSNSYTLTSTTTYPNTKALVDGLAAERTYAEGLVVGLWDDRGNFDASVNAYPSSGGSGTAGAIVKGDIWTISVAGTLPNSKVVELGDTVRALIDSPGNFQTDWAIAQNNIGYIPENVANKEGTIAGNEASTTKYPTIKGIVDWTVANVFNPKISTDPFNNFIAGSDGGGYYKEYLSGLVDTPGFSANAGDVVSVGGFNGTNYINLTDQNSVIIFVNGVLATFTNGVIVLVGTDLQWGVTLVAADVNIYWRYKP